MDFEVFTDHGHDLLRCEVVCGLFLGIGEDMVEVFLGEFLFHQLLECEQLEQDALEIAEISEALRQSQHLLLGQLQPFHAAVALNVSHTDFKGPAP